MQPLAATDLWPLPVYEGVRDEFRRTVIDAKKNRRIGVGPFMTFVFENRLTVKFQVMEILRVEKVTDPAGVAEELAGFNTMLPHPHGLSATLLIEKVGPEAEVKVELARLSGLNEHVFLEVGDTRVRGAFDSDRDDGSKVSAVQYIQFDLGAAEARFSQGEVALVIDHPNYSYRQALTPPQRDSLAGDLAAS